MKYKTVRIPVIEKDKRELQWVYFILSDEIKRKNPQHSYSTGYKSVERRVKIGMSQKEEGVIKRFNSIRSDSPSELYMLGYMPAYEKDWHQYLKTYRIKGEWFTYEPIKEIIMSIKLKVPEEILNKFREDYVYSFRPKNASYTSNKPGPEWDEYFREEKRMKNIFSLTKEYRRSIFNEDLFSDPYEDPHWSAEREKQDYNFITEHSDKIVKMLNVFNFGEPFIGDMPNGKVVITESKTTKLDILDNVIHPKEIYYRTGTYGVGLSVRSAHKLYEIFEGYMRTRKRRRSNFKYKSKLNGEFAKKNYTPKEIDLLERKEMFEEELYDINKELGIIYFNNDTQQWVNKEKQKMLARYEEGRENEFR